MFSASRNTQPEIIMSIEQTLAERETRHGQFEAHAQISQSLKRVMRCTDKWGELAHYQKEALEMIVHKIARALNGDADFADHWHDIAGYAVLVEKALG